MDSFKYLPLNVESDNQWENKTLLNCDHHDGHETENLLGNQACVNQKKVRRKLTENDIFSIFTDGNNSHAVFKEDH